MLGRRLNEYRNNFAMPADLKLPNLSEGDRPSVMGKAEGDGATGYKYGRSFRLCFVAWKERKVGCG